MSQALTIDDIWKLFQETNRLFQESKLEWERRCLKSDLDFEETRRMMRESSAETDRQFKETDRKIKEVSRQVGQLGSRWGEFVEGLVAPACKTLFMERGISVHKVSQRVKAELEGSGRRMEVDLLVVNSGGVVLVEVKSKLKREDVREHVTRVSEFKEFFPEYADKRVMGAVAGIVIEEQVDRYAMNEGLFVIVQAGDAVQLANDAAFQPRVW